MSLSEVKSPAPNLLQASWNEWTNVVRRFARHGVHTAEFSRQGYRELHSRLQGDIDRSLEEMTVDAGVLRGMKELSAPWPSLDSLAMADRKLLQDLLDRCAAIQKTWSGAGRAASHRRTTAAVALLLFLAVFAAALLLMVTQRNPDRLRVDIQFPFAGLLRTVFGGGWNLRSGIPAVCVAVVVALITWMVFRPPRRD